MKWGVHVHWSRKRPHIYMPVRYKMTFYISSVSLICMAVLAAICIVESRNDSLSLVAERLAQFASIRASQIERDLDDQAALLDFAMQGSLVTTTIMSLYFGNVTAESWAQNLKDIVSDMFTTSIRTYEALIIYDVSGNMIFSMANPDDPAALLNKLTPAIPSMLPFSSTLYGENVTLPYNQNSTSHNETVTSAAAAAAVAAAKNATSDPHHSSGRSPQSLNFSRTNDNISAWLSQPAPLVNSSGIIDGYSYALTVPVSYTTIINKTQVSRLIGYCSAILDCSHYMNYTAFDDMSELSEMEIMRKAWISVTAANDTGWRYLFPTGPSILANVQPFTSFPAIEEDMRLRSRLQNDNGRKPGGAMMNTNTPKAKKASVGYSYVRAVNNEWYVTVELPRSQAESPIWHLTKLLCAVAVSLLVLVTGAAYLLSGMATFPLFYIYRAMELRAKDEQSDPEMNGKQTHKVKDLLLVTPALYKTNHTRLSKCLNAMTQSLKRENAENKMSAEPRRKVASAQKTISSVETDSTMHPNNVRQNSSAALHSDSDGSAKTVVASPYGVEDAGASVSYQIPAKIPPLNRPITDEFDDLVTEYNNMIDHLAKRYTEMEYEVRERTKEAQESKEHAEAANEAKTKFLMNISHELITPMNGIIGIAAITEEETDLMEIRQSLRTIIESGKLLQELLEAILNYNSYLAGVETKPESFLLKGLIADLKATFRAQSNANGTPLDITCRPNTLEDGRFEGALKPILHICAGLVSNALKFSDPKKVAVADAMPPTVTIRTCLREPDSLIDISTLRGQPDDDEANYAMLEIVIADTGVGIEREQLGHVFDEFVQGEDALSKRFTGTGLGLALSKLLSDRIGGYIAVYSGVKVGSTAVLRVPVKNVLGLEVERAQTKMRPEFYRNNSPVWWTDSKRRRIYYEPGESAATQDRVSIHGDASAPSFLGERLLVGSAKDVAGEVPQTAMLTRKLRGAGEGTTESSANRELALSSLDTSKPPGCSTPGMSINEDFSKLRVIVADDNQVLRDILQKMLRKLGIVHVDIAEDGLNVIKKIEQAIVLGTRYSIIFMDLSMPTTDGIWATKDIRRQLGYFCPVVALTGYSDETTIKECLEAGIQKVLTKPVELEHLKQTLRQLVLKRKEEA